jgi:predicted O-linked N-acetylglucosamine transferase (SPINDLY family)
MKHRKTSGHARSRATPGLPREEVAQLVQLFNAGRHAEVETRTRLLTLLHPDVGMVWKILGAAQLAQGKDALVALQKAVDLLPGDAESHSNLGNALRARGRFDEALLSHQQALKFKPDSPSAHFNLAIVLQDLGRFDAAVASYEQALTWQPGLIDAHFNLAITLTQMGRLDDAVARYDRLLQIKPDHAGALLNRGIVYKDLGRYEEATRSFHDIIQRDPNAADAFNNLGNLLKDQGQIDEAVACFRRVLERKPEAADAHSNLLLALNYSTELSPHDLLVEARRYGMDVAARAQPRTSWRNDIDRQKRLRVGFVSGDLCQHPVGYFVDGVFAALKAQCAHSLELFVYASRPDRDGLTERIASHVDHWCMVAGDSDQRLSQRIVEDGIDILVDLSGHTGGNRLPMFAWKPAPIQVSWLGYFATTGVQAIDHVLADPYTVLASDEGQFTEHVWRLPETRMCFTPPDESVPVAPLPALERRQITFGCFNNLAKMNDAVVALWARVLHAVPGSRLFLKAKQLGELATQQAVQQRFAAQGIGADRLHLEGKSPRAAYLAAYAQVDLALDPFPFTGGTTTAECLWMGVPVLTLQGDRMVSRQGVGLMVNAGLADWVAQDADDYVARAVRLVADLDGLAALRARLREQVRHSPVFDASRFAAHLEAALREMWVNWCDRQGK